MYLTAKVIIQGTDDNAHYMTRAISVDFALL